MHGPHHWRANDGGRESCEIPDGVHYMLDYGSSVESNGSPRACVAWMEWSLCDPGIQDLDTLVVPDGRAAVQRTEVWLWEVVGLLGYVRGACVYDAEVDSQYSCRAPRSDMCNVCMIDGAR